MKTTKGDRWQGAGDKMANAAHFCPASTQPLGAAKQSGDGSTLHLPFGFTLTELLVVIAIMGVLASLLLAVVGGVKKKEYVWNAQAELEQLTTAIERYKAAYGFYPPDSRLAPAIPSQPTVNQLYYELEGTTGDGTSYTNLDGSATIAAADVPTAFGVGGFMNCTKPGAGEDSAKARNFLPDLKPAQVWKPYTNNGVGITLLVCSVGGPDQAYKPLGVSDLNPWRYNSSNPTNNPGAYDLWVQLAIGASTNVTTHTYGPLYLICNWSKQVQINNPLP